MSSIDDRLKKLEAEEPERCDNCREWGDTPRLIDRCHTDGTISGPPERCSECGYEMITLIIEESHEAAKM